MKWIKYKVLQCTVGDTTVLLNKKLGYSDENIAIAEAEAYNGYEIIEDSQTFDKEPLSVELGGTGAKTAAVARQNIGAMPSKIDGVSEPMLIITDAKGNVIASRTFNGDLTINGTVTATKVVGAVYM